MTNESLEQRAHTTYNEADERRDLRRDQEMFVAYKPANVSVKLEVEAYSAMRYHGQ